MKIVKLKVLFASEEAEKLQELGLQIEDEGDEGFIYVSVDNICYFNENYKGQTVLRFNDGSYVIWDGSPIDFMTEISEFIE